jgi:hypothetical protein
MLIGFIKLFLVFFRADVKTIDPELYRGEDGAQFVMKISGDAGPFFFKRCNFCKDL